MYDIHKEFHSPVDIPTDDDLKTNDIRLRF